MGIHTDFIKKVNISRISINLASRPKSNAKKTQKHKLINITVPVLKK